MMVPLLETVLKIFLQRTSQQHHIALDVRNVTKSLSLQGIFQSSKGHKIARGLVR
jgi:hypothetical protein